MMKTPVLPRRKGFALVVTLSLMILLTVVAVGLLSLASVTLRSSSQGQAQAQARANARLALMMAIGDLQKYAGPDTRVTANADMRDANSPNPHWLGVWKTRPGEDAATGNPGEFPIGHSASNLYLTDTRNPGNPAAASRWLVSSPDTAGIPSNTRPDNSFVTILDTGVAETTVKVPKLPINASGAYAWWVSDESQKALINLPDAQTDSSDRKQFSLVAAQDFDFEAYKSASSIGKPLAGHASAKAKDLSKVVTLDTGDLLPLNDAASFRKVLAEASHDLTANSMGLFTNVRDSGLKRDFSAFLARGDIAADPATGLAGLRVSDPILPGNHHLQTSPRYGILKGWADLADQLDKDSGAASMTPQPPKTLYQSFANSAAGPIRDLNNVSVPAIEPVVVEASLGWDFSPYTNPSTGAPSVRSHLYPRVILWNPFNVTLKATQYVALLRHPTYGSFTARGQAINTNASRFYFNVACGSPTSAFLGFVTEPTELLPGETKIFTPSINASSGTKLFGKSAAFDPVNYDSNVLTAEQIPGVECFHFDMPTALPAETPANKDLSYGFSSDSNSFYCTPGYADEFLVSQVVGTPRGRITWSSFTANSTSFPRIAHFICQNWGLNRYHKWYAAEKNDHASNNGTPFREFKPGAPNIGEIDNRRPPRLWRRGVRMSWFDDRAEFVANQSQPVWARYTQPWFASSNIRGGLLYHRNWVNLPFSNGWTRPAFDSHTYFLQPTDPQLLSTFFPPSPFAAPDDGFPSTCTVYDVPRRKTGIISMGQLQHAQLSYSTWHPSFVIGNGEQTMNADRDATAIKNKIGDRNRWVDNPGNTLDYATIIQKGRADEVLVYDLSYEANEELWDRFMLLSIPYQGAVGNRKPQWDLNTPLPVGRYILNPNSRRLDRDAVAKGLSSEPSFPYFRSAEFLANRGAFNINSTSVQAWASLLGNMRGLKRESLDSGVSQGDHPLARSVISGTPGVNKIDSASEPDAWNAFRSLSDKDIENLAQKIVVEVRNRGPFLSIADFVNRRLTTDPKYSAHGTLDQAIAAAGINGALDNEGLTEVSKVGSVPTAANRSHTITYGMPGYFSQGDLLTAIAPVITARGDTFRIRTYGESRSSDGKISRAWCEAVVQRNIDYIDPKDDPLKPAIQTVNGTAAIGALEKTNLIFGRRFTIVSFKWLPGVALPSTS